MIYILNKQNFINATDIGTFTRDELAGKEAC